MRRRIINNLYTAITVALAALPAPLLYTAVMVKPSFAPLTYFALAAVLALGVAFLPRWRKPAGIISSIMLIAAYVLAGGMALFPSYWGMPFAAILIAFQWFAMICITRPSGETFTPQMLGGFAIAHMAAAGAARGEVFNLVRGVLWWVSIPFFVICAFRLNVMSVAGGASLRKTGAPPSRILCRNALMVAGLAALAAVFANLNHVGGAVRKLVGWVIFGVLWLMSLFGGSGDTAPQGGDGGMGDMFAGIEAAEPSAFAIWAERIAAALAAVALAAGLCWLAVVAWRKAGVYIRRFIAKLRGVTDSLNQSYHDDAESLFDWGEIRRAAVERVRAPFLRGREPRWDALDDRQKVRYAVKVSLKRKPDLPVSGTVRSLISSGALPVGTADAPRLSRDYDAARYSSAEPGEGAARNAGKALGK